MHLFCILNGGMETASARERLLRYLPDLARSGITTEIHIAGDVPPGWTGRIDYWRRLLRALRTCDGILIHRVPLSAPERATIRASRRPMIFDVDDAMWYQMDPDPAGGPRKSLRFNDLRATLNLARLIRAGNHELARYLEPLGIPLRIAPTCVLLPSPRPPLPSGPPVIGWMGHSSNFRYLTYCLPALRRLVRERPEIRIRIVADRPAELPGIPAEFVPWSLETEEEQLRSFSIGIMPLADTPWTRGKCGYKLLLYMAHGIPAVASPVGVNAGLIQHGVNGYLARTEEEWFTALRELVDRPERRREMGQAGRAAVQGRYDREAGLKVLLRDLRETLHPRSSKPSRAVTLFLFHHPPLGGSASVRNAALARRLRDRGWAPRVVTISRWPSYFRDPTIAGVPAALRAAAPDPAILLSPLFFLGWDRPARALSRWIFPDRALPWTLAALPGALRLARGSCAILSTSPPESAHLLAWAVKKLTGRPWIADHSNEWTDNPAREDPRFLTALHRCLERGIMASADRITTLSPHHTRLLQQSYPAPERIHTLWTGWEPSEARPPALRPREERAVILFAGMFYGIQKPDPFLDAAERAGTEELEFHVLGDAWDSTDRLRRSPLPVRFLGRLPRAEALKRMREADFLLITLTERGGGVVPGKMFEYAAAGRPILAVVPPEGEVARWVRETRTGFVLPCTPPEEAAQGLRDLLRRWRSGALRFEPDPEALRRYSAPVMADLLDRILRETIASR